MDSKLSVLSSLVLCFLVTFLVGVAYTFSPGGVVSTTTRECNKNYPGQSPVSNFARCSCHCCVDLGGEHHSSGGPIFGGAHCDGVPWYNVPLVTACLAFCLPSCPFVLESGCVRSNARLRGDDVVPPVDTDASGLAVVDFETITNSFQLGLTAGHLHGPLDDTILAEVRLAATGEDGPPLWQLTKEPFGVIVVELNDQNVILQPDHGIFTFDDARDAVLSGNTYIEVATATFPEGEIRGQIIVDCVGDLDSDGSVGAADLFTLLASWGPCPGCAADFDGDDIVGASDLLAMLFNWGPCP